MSNEWRGQSSGASSGPSLSDYGWLLWGSSCDIRRKKVVMALPSCCCCSSPTDSPLLFSVPPKASTTTPKSSSSQPPTISFQCTKHNQHYAAVTHHQKAQNCAVGGIMADREVAILVWRWGMNEWPWRHGLKKKNWRRLPLLLAVWLSIPIFGKMVPHPPPPS